MNNAPSAPLPGFVRLSGLWWAIEQCVQETKEELGMVHYEVRKFLVWHRYMLTCMLAHFFHRYLKVRLGEKAPSITLSQIRKLIGTVLPVKKWDT